MNTIFLQGNEQSMNYYSLTFILLTLSLTSLGQSKIIRGKIINSDFPTTENLSEHEFWNASGAAIIGNGSIRLGTADEQGVFELEVPNTIQTLTIASVGMYPERFELTDSCEYFEVILLPDAIYDFVTLKREERLRKKDRKDLTQLYIEAFKRGIFAQEKPCR
jgi:hypothetical protein